MKAGREELMEIVDLWGYSPEAQAQIQAILESESPPPPHLFRYYGPVSYTHLDVYKRQG